MANLTVALNGIEVGVLSLERSGAMSFRYLPILKLPIGFLTHSNIDLRDSNENEWLCLKILEAFGLAVAKADQADTAIAKVEALLPAAFPCSVSEPILDGLGHQLKRLEEKVLAG